MYKNEDILQPPGYVPTENEIALAKAVHVMKNYIYGMLDHLSTYNDIQNGKNPPYHTKEKWNEMAIRDSQRWKDVKANWKNGSLFDAFMSDEQFKEYYVDALSDMHLGDCVSYPMTCDRCYAEGLFKVPYTANWSKKEGYRLMEEYVADFNEKNPDHKFEQDE